MMIRPTTLLDVPTLQRVLDRTELFPSEMLEDMLTPFADGTDPDALWLTAFHEGEPVGFCYSAAEMLTEGTWNMRAIAVAPDVQSRGIGAALAAATEANLRDAGQRVLIVDTSGTDDFARTRAFYDRNGYTQEARIRDFWSEGDDKVIYRKQL